MREFLACHRVVFPGAWTPPVPVMLLELLPRLLFLYLRYAKQIKTSSGLCDSNVSALEEEAMFLD